MDMVILLYIAGALALVALAALLFYIITTLKRVNLMLEDAKKMTEALIPAMGQVDPLMSRINLTMDAANVEIMRVDEILEDISVITDKLAGTTSTVNDIANVPLNAVNSVTSKVRGAFRGHAASATSADLGAQKEAQEASAE